MLKLTATSPFSVTNRDLGTEMRLNEDPPCGDWFVTSLCVDVNRPRAQVESGYLSCQPGGALRVPRIRPIHVESELQLTIREPRSRGSAASLDVREGFSASLKR